MRSAFAPFVIAKSNGSKTVKLEDFLVTGEPPKDPQKTGLREKLAQLKSELAKFPVIRQIKAAKDGKG